jgi:hypothetical protein
MRTKPGRVEFRDLVVEDVNHSHSSNIKKIRSFVERRIVSNLLAHTTEQKSLRRKTSG